MSLNGLLTCVMLGEYKHRSYGEVVEVRDSASSVPSHPLNQSSTPFCMHQKQELLVLFPPIWYDDIA